MRNVLRRITFGVLATGMLVAMAAGATVVAASAAVAAPHHATHKTKALSWPTVKQGDSGNRVLTIQYLLNDRGYKVAVDGAFGSTTKTEVQKFQKAKGLKVDGIVGSATWEKLIRTVKQGDNGDAVKAVQSYLKSAYGFSKLTVDGAFGASTTTAVKDFQNKYKIKDDGVVGDVTWNALVVNHS
jgi:peptidoglycan hydrolase-like protein with peptidoglycan-binding domain